MKTYTCHFGKGVSCTVQVADTILKKGESHILGMRWSKKPKPSVIPSYVKWMHQINQQCADELNVRLLYIVKTTPTSWETWCYEPNGQPEKV